MKLRHYQKLAVRYLLNNPHSGLLAKPGLGKTLVTLVVLGHVLKQSPDTKVLIIAPKNVCELVWPQEIEKWGFPYKAAYMHGSYKNKVAANPPTLVLTTPDTFRRMADKLWVDKGSHFPWDVLVVDESSFFKSPKTARFKTLKKVLSRHELQRTHILTGTPQPNHLLELWPQMWLADQGKALGNSFYSYRSRFFYQSGHGGYTWQPFDGADKKVYSLIKESNSAIALMSEELVDVPPLLEQQIRIELPASVRGLYKDMETKFRAELQNGAVTAVNAAVKAGKLRQFTAGAVYTDGDTYEVIHTAKAAAIRDLVQERQGAPLMVFYEYIHESELLKKALKDFRVADLSKAGSRTHRIELAEQWRRGEIEVLLLHPKSAGHGLNLQCPNADVCWSTLPWSGELYEQGNSRIHRQGQETSVVSYLITAAKTVDELVLERLRDKAKGQKRLFDFLKERL